MSDDKTNVGRDRERISLEQDYEVRSWTRHFGVSEEALREAVRKAGHSVDAVARELGKDAPPAQGA